MNKQPIQVAKIVGFEGHCNVSSGTFGRVTLMKIKEMMKSLLL